jgi:hypothetical protein
MMNGTPRLERQGTKNFLEITSAHDKVLGESPEALSEPVT